MPNSHLSSLYAGSFGLMTDLYQLTMAYGYWKNGWAERRAAFHLFFRRAPFGQDYAVAAGLELAADFLQGFRFSAEDVQYLGGLTGSNGQPLFNEAFLNYLQRMTFRCDVHAMPEGSIAFPHQPLLRVEGPLLQCQLIETVLLTLVNYSTLIATKSARIVRAAQGDSVLEFGMRRAQGLDGAITAARAAYIGGCHATSNVKAGQLYRIPVKGTHAHSWVMCFGDELEAFRRYADALPNNCIFLVDTYDSLTGVEHAIRVGRQLREAGHEMVGIRLDSGDLAGLSRQARQLLDDAGFPDAAIVASNELDEYSIQSLKDRGAAIGVWGVGTNLVAAADQPALGGVYKLSAVQNEQGEWEDRLKLSEEAIKTSNPGRQQVWRRYDGERPVGDAIQDVRDEAPGQQVWDYRTQAYCDLPDGQWSNLMQTVFRGGELVYEFPDLQAVRSYSLGEQQRFAHIDSSRYPNGLTSPLYERKMHLVATVEE
ncbi:MAG: nicotinate phosphoribosyltransferase [Bacteroidetes bacterium]|jgi:nicotinate phosphoribosyltransferase|nr:nicotinate phosphoribosyltransferase [Bacteroidota bacterium]